MSQEGVGGRLGRLLAAVPWIAARPDGASLEEMAEQFGCTVARIETDLGLLGEVEPEAGLNVRMWEEDGRWYVDATSVLNRPLRITADDAFDLMAAAQSILQVPGVDPTGALASAVRKLARAIGGDVTGLSVLLPRPPLLDLLQDAVRDRACVEIDYYSAWTDLVSSRVVEPLVVFTIEGRWHMIGWCHTAEAERDFRVDRVRAARLTGETFAPRALTLRTDVAFDPEPAAPTIALRMEVQPAQRWAVDRYAVRDVVDMPDGATQFTLDIAGDPWLERLLLRLGPDARVLEPVGLTAGAEAAGRILDVYNRK